MSGPTRGPASFMTQVDALLRKDLTFQKRNMKTNIRLILFPVVILLLLRGVQSLVDSYMERMSDLTKQKCDPNVPWGPSCLIPRPLLYPPVIHVPVPQYRAVKTDGFPGGASLPDESCRSTGTCPVSLLLTGANKTLAQSLATSMFPDPKSLMTNPNSSNLVIYGTEIYIDVPNYEGPISMANSTVYSIQSQCTSNSGPNLTIVGEQLEGVKDGDMVTNTKCVQALALIEDSSSNMNDALYKGFQKGNPAGKINEIVAGYDILNTNQKVFNVSISFNKSYYLWKEVDGQALLSGKGANPMLMIPKLVNLITNAFLRYFQDSNSTIDFNYLKEMPKTAVLPPSKLDFASLIGTLFFTWIILQLFPVILASLVYEKEHQLRIMMNMHGLSDSAYWIISYSYFLFISFLYILVFVIFGILIGLDYFRRNAFSLQIVFYFIFINLQIAGAFLLASFFSNARSATVVAYVGLFATGFMADALFKNLISDREVSRGWVTLFELYPGFALYRGLHEFAMALQLGGTGLKWSDLSKSKNGMQELFVIMFVEWLILLAIAYFVDQVASGKGKIAAILSGKFQKKIPSQLDTSNTLLPGDKHDVIQEREKVDKLLLERNKNCTVVCDNLKKVHPGTDGNPDVFAVRGLSLALPKGECFGMLGPNGAGKTSFINLMIGISKPNGGTAFVEGLDILSEMSKIYTSMGACPQYDLLWGNLTGREHLLFYGRLKNLKGSELTEAVEQSLKSVNLFKGGVGDRAAGKYSGGMKRRLSVAISLIGDPKVVYLDEPSTGLDPASRENLWTVVKNAKRDRAIVLTTHSMEEAEALCDRLGFFMDGSLQCIGYPKELKTRYGGFYIFTMTTKAEHEHEVEQLVRGFCASANKVYHLSGTQKFELPKEEVKIAQVFRAVEKAKNRFDITAWGLVDTTLEDVFIKITQERGGPALH